MRIRAGWFTVFLLGNRGEIIRSQWLSDIWLLSQWRNGYGWKWLSWHSGGLHGWPHRSFEVQSFNSVLYMLILFWGILNVWTFSKHIYTDWPKKSMTGSYCIIFSLWNELCRHKLCLLKDWLIELFSYCRVSLVIFYVIYNYFYLNKYMYITVIYILFI